MSSGTAAGHDRPYGGVPHERRRGRGSFPAFTTVLAPASGRLDEE